MKLKKKNMMTVLNNIFNEKMIEALAFTIMHSLWIGALLSVLLNIILQIIRKSAKLRYNIASGGLVLFAALLVLVFLKQYNAYQSQDFTTTLNISPVSSSGIIADKEIISTVATTSSTFVNTISREFNDFCAVNSVLITLLWIIGILIFGLKYIGGFFYSARMKSLGIMSISGDWEKKLKELKSRIRIKKSVLIYESIIAKAPMVIGWIKPVILIPAGAISGIPADQVEAIIAHELAHIKRNDYIINIFQSFLELVLFYNPSVWWISGIIRKERENCCDDIAIEICIKPLVYAKALLSLQEQALDTPPLAVAFTGTKKNLINRIKRITKMSQEKNQITNKWLAILMIAILLSGLALTSGLTSCNTAAATTSSTTVNAATSSSNDLSIAPLTEVSEVTEDMKEMAVLENIDEIENQDIYILNTQDTLRSIMEGHITTHWVDPSDNIEKKVKMKLENGEVKELIIDGQVIPEDEYPVYQDLIDDTIADLKEAEEDIREAQEDIEDALKDIAEIDFEAIEADIQNALQDIEEIDLEKIMEDIEESMMEIEEIDIEDIQADIQEALREIEEMEIEEIQIDLEEIMEIEKIDIEEILEEIESIDFENMKMQIEESRKELDSAKIKIMEEKMEMTKLEMEKTLKEISEYNGNKKDEILKNLEQQKIELAKKLVEIQEMLEKK